MLCLALKRTDSVAVSAIDSEAANDQLFVNTLGGNDNVNVGAGVASLIQVVVDLGAGE